VVKFLLKVLWYDFMEEKVKKWELEWNINLYKLVKPWVNVNMIYNENWYIVLKWSVWKNQETKSLRTTYKKLKRQLIDEWSIIVKWDAIEFVKDIEFTSATWPVQILLWYSASWPESWKNENWKTLKENEVKI